MGEYELPTLPEPTKDPPAGLTRKKRLNVAFGEIKGPKKRREEASESPEGPEPPAGSEMSESQVLKMMNRKKKFGSPGRGKESTKKRIAKEMEEWESAKQNNPEYWKPPKFCQVLG